MSMQVGRDLLRSRIEEALDVLSWREREVIKMRYGLGDGYNYTLTDVGKVFRVSRERIRRIEAEALQRLQQAEPSRTLCNFVERPISPVTEDEGTSPMGNVGSPIQSV